MVQIPNYDSLAHHHYHHQHLDQRGRWCKITKVRQRITITAVAITTITTITTKCERLTNLGLALWTVYLVSAPVNSQARD